MGVVCITLPVKVRFLMVEIAHIMHAAMLGPVDDELSFSAEFYPAPHAFLLLLLEGEGREHLTP